MLFCNILAETRSYFVIRYFYRNRIFLMLVEQGPNFDLCVCKTIVTFNWSRNLFIKVRPLCDFIPIWTLTRLPIVIC